MQQEEKQIEVTTIVDKANDALSVENETKEQKEKIREDVVNAMKETFTEDVINNYLRKYSPGERNARQESLRNDLGELATTLKSMAVAGDLNFKNEQVTKAVICDFLGSKRLTRLTKIIKGEEIGLADEDFLEKATEDGLNIPLSGEQYGMGDGEKKDATEAASEKPKAIISEKDFFEKAKISPDKIYVNSAGKKMKVVGYKNNKVQIAFLPNGTKVEDGVNVISLDSEWNSDADGKEVGVAEFLAMLVDYDEMPEGTSRVVGEKAKEKERAEKVDSMEVADAKKEKGEVLSLKDLTELFGVAGSVHATEDGAKKLEILNYLYKKDETKWEIEVKESETGEKKMLSPEDLQDLIATKYTKIDLIPEVEAGGMKSAEFVAEFGKSGEFVFKSDLGGLKSFVIEKDKFSEQSKQHMVKIHSAGEESGRYVSVKELRQMISNGMYRKEPNSSEAPKTEKKEEDDEELKGGAETGVKPQEPKSKDSPEAKKPTADEKPKDEVKTDTDPAEPSLKDAPGTEKKKDDDGLKEVGGKTGTHFEEWMKKTENFREERKNTEELKDVDLAVLQDEFSQLSEIRNSLLSKKDRTDQENSQLQEVELSLNKYKEEIEGRGESVVETKPLNIDDIVGDDETKKGPENPENKKEGGPKIKTEKEKLQEEQRKMDEKFEAWKESQVDFEKKGNELGIAKRNLAKMGISFGEDAEVMKEFHNAKKAMEKAEKDFKNAHIEFVAPLAEKNKAALKHSKVEGLKRNEMMREYLFSEKLIEKKSVDENGNEKIEELSLMEDLGNKMLELNQARKEALSEREKGTVEKLFAKYQKAPKEKKLLWATVIALALGAGGAFLAGAGVGAAVGTGAFTAGTRLVRSLVGGALSTAVFMGVQGRRESTREKRKKTIEGTTINRTIRGGKLDMVSMVQKKANLERKDNLKAMAAAGITGVIVGGGIRVAEDWTHVLNAFSPDAPAVSVAEAKSVENPDSRDYEVTNDNPDTKGFSDTEVFKNHQARFTNEKYQEFLEANGGETSANKMTWLKMMEDSREEYLKNAGLEVEAGKQGSVSEERIETSNPSSVEEVNSSEKVQRESSENPVVSETENSNETISSNNQPETILTEDPKVLADRQLSEKLKELKIDEKHEAWKALRGMKLGEVAFLPRSGEEAINAFRDRTLRLPPEVSSKLGTLDIREAKEIGQIMGAVFREVDQSAVGSGNIKLEDVLRGDYEVKSMGAGFSNKPAGPLDVNTFPAADKEYLRTVINEEPPSSSGQEAPQEIAADKEKVVFDNEDKTFIEEGGELDPRVLENIKGKDFNAKLGDVKNYVRTEIEVNKNSNLEDEYYGKHAKAILAIDKIEKSVGFGERSLQESIDKYIAAGNKLDASEIEGIGKFVKYIENFEDKNSVSKGEEIPKTPEIDLRALEDIKGKDFNAKLGDVKNYVRTEVEVNKNSNLEDEYYGKHAKAILAIDKIEKKVGFGEQSLQESIDKYIASGNKLDASEMEGIGKFVKYIEKFKTV